MLLCKRQHEISCNIYDYDKSIPRAETETDAEKDKIEEGPLVG